MLFTFQCNKFEFCQGLFRAKIPCGKRDRHGEKKTLSLFSFTVFLTIFSGLCCNDGLSLSLYSSFQKRISAFSEQFSLSQFRAIMVVLITLLQNYLHFDIFCHPVFYSLQLNKTIQHFPYLFSYFVKFLLLLQQSFYQIVCSFLIQISLFVAATMKRIFKGIEKLPFVVNRIASFQNQTVRTKLPVDSPGNDN